ncbi:MAG: ATP-binding protein [Alphaproteobacteria bacterium]
MTYFWPQSLASRTIALVIAGLVVTHVVTVITFSGHRADSLTRADEQHIAQHIASIANIVISAPSPWRDRIVRASDDHAFRVYMKDSDGELADGAKGRSFDSLNDALSRQMRSVSSEPLSVSVREVSPQSDSTGVETARHLFRQWIERLVYGHDRDQAVFVSIPFSQYQELNFSTVMPLAHAAGWERTLATTGSFVLAVLLLSLWAVRQLSTPLHRFAAAATAFARNVHAPALPEDGPTEVRKAARAFNDMQRQIRQLVDNRSQMLAAISHDLRTPLTAVRLRAESVSEPELRDKMLAALDEMNLMLASSLAFARVGADDEPLSIVDVGALLEALCDDLADTGQDVTCAVDGDCLTQGRPLALKRALANLIDNAVNYGNCAQVRVTSHEHWHEITVDDEGCGIPEPEMGRVFLPFFRVEPSRSRDTGGVGLGLAIAQTILDSHGGAIDLSNRPEGGLRVRVRLNRFDQAAQTRTRSRGSD